MELDDFAKKYLNLLLDNAQYSFEVMSSRWDDLRPQRQFGLKISEDFHLGYVFGKIEEEFVEWFYSNYARSPEDDEYKQFWSICRKHVRKTT